MAVLFYVVHFKFDIWTISFFLAEYVSNLSLWHLPSPMFCQTHLLCTEWLGFYHVFNWTKGLIKLIFVNIRRTMCQRGYLILSNTAHFWIVYRLWLVLIIHLLSFLLLVDYQLLILFNSGRRHEIYFCNRSTFFVWRGKRGHANILPNKVNPARFKMLTIGLVILHSCLLGWLLKGHVLFVFKKAFLRMILLLTMKVLVAHCFGRWRRFICQVIITVDGIYLMVHQLLSWEVLVLLRIVLLLYVYVVVESLSMLLFVDAWQMVISRHFDR